MNADQLLDWSLVPYGMTVPELHLPPTWDKLCADARFEQLLAKHSTAR